MVLYFTRSPRTETLGWFVSVGRKPNSLEETPFRSFAELQGLVWGSSDLQLVLQWVQWQLFPLPICSSLLTEPSTSLLALFISWARDLSGFCSTCLASSGSVVPLCWCTFYHGLIKWLSDFIGNHCVILVAVCLFPFILLLKSISAFLVEISHLGYYKFCI